jgi:hypothetical protein
MRLGHLCAMILILYLPARLVTADPIDDLKGLSVEVTWIQHGSFHHPPDERWVVDSGQKGALHIYISLKGNIFHHEQFDAGGKNKRDWHRVAALNTATSEGPHGLTYTWTMTGGQLVRTSQMLEGLRVMTIVIDPTKTTCAFQAKDVADAKTGRFWVYRALDGTPSEIQGRTVDSYSCTVKRGNIFGSDQ